MTAAITDLITSPSNGTRPVSTTVEVSRSTGITSLSCADLTGWSTTTPVHFVTYKIDGQGNVVAGSQADWKGIVSGTTINSLVITGGTDAGNSVGDIVEILPTARWGKELTDALLKEHNVDGTHGTIATLNATNATVTGILTASGSVTLPAASVTASNIDFTTFASRQDNGSNSLPNGLKLKYGWGWVQVGGTAVSQIDDTLTFDSPFTTVPLVVATYAGDAGNQTASQTTGGATYIGNASCRITQPATTGCKVTVSAASGTWPAAATIYYNWIAIGN